MTHPDPSECRMLPAADVGRVLARAAALDAARQGEVSVAQLREAAGEAGISSDALEAALREPPASASAPLWVRVCLLGVPDRRAAMVFYWLFVGLMVLTPLAASVVQVWAPSTVAVAVVPILLAVALWWFFALWSTSRAVRWADDHGWERLS